MIRIYTVAIPSVHCRRIAIIGQLLKDKGQLYMYLQQVRDSNFLIFWGIYFNFNGGFARK